jgi:hypothetical protein
MTVFIEIKGCEFHASIDKITRFTHAGIADKNTSYSCGKAPKNSKDINI